MLTFPNLLSSCTCNYCEFSLDSVCQLRWSDHYCLL